MLVWKIAFAVLAFPYLSCTKQESGQQSGTFDQHLTWKDSKPEIFWDKQPDGGFQIDIVWDGDTTIYF